MSETASRREYHQKYYQKNKERIRQNYNAQTQYVKWVDVKKIIFVLKRRIGTDAYNLIIDELSKLNRARY